MRLFTSKFCNAPDTELQDLGVDDIISSWRRLIFGSWHLACGWLKPLVIFLVLFFKWIQNLKAAGLNSATKQEYIITVLQQNCVCFSGAWIWATRLGSKCTFKSVRCFLFKFAAWKNTCTNEALPFPVYENCLLKHQAIFFPFWYVHRVTHYSVATATVISVFILPGRKEEHRASLQGRC